MSTVLTLTTGRLPDGSPVLNAAGEIDMSNAAELAAALTAAREACQRPLVVDLTRVEYIDSAGLSTLFPHVEHLRLRAAPLLAPVLAVAGLDDITTITDE